MDLSRTNITSLPPEFPVGLTHLICSNNPDLTKLTNLPNTLQYLDCGYCYITKLPEKLLASLTKLDICFNKMEQLPILPNKLQHLDCHYNKLTHLPNLPNSIETLDANGNFIQILPALPPKLEYLSICSNQLKSLPDIRKFENNGLRV